MKDIEQIRCELIRLIEFAGGDNKAADLLKPLCDGFAPDRSTLGKFRRGEGKPALLAMTTSLLRSALKDKIADIQSHRDHVIEVVGELVTSTQLIIACLSQEDIAESDKLKMLEKRLQAALEVVATKKVAIKKVVVTKLPKSPSTIKKKQTTRKPNIKGSRLDKHRERIIRSIEDGIPKEKIAKELDVNISTLSRFIVKQSIMSDERLQPSLDIVSGDNQNILSKHHAYIVKAIKSRKQKNKIAEHIGVDRKTLYTYIKKHNL